MRFWLATLLLSLLAAGPALAQMPSQHGGAATGGEPEAPALPDDAFRVYTADGTPATLADIVAAMDTAAVVFLGERHDDPTAHALQDSLFAQALVHADTAGRPVALSLEMFERDTQPVLNEYLAGLIAERHFVEAARAWSNYDDYRPLVEAAKEAEAPVLAANAPRRYVNRVAREGAEALADLPPHAAPWLPPLPYPGPTDAYRAKWADLMRASMPPGHGEGDADNPHADADDADADDADAPADTTTSAEAASPHGGSAAPAMSMEGMLQAQSLWDATMAYTMADYLMRAPNALVVHLTGSFHMTGGTGTPEALRHYRPGVRTLTVAMQPASDVNAFDADEHAGLGDFVVLTDFERLPRQNMMGMR